MSEQRTRVVGYIRVSTDKQEESGLGLEDQEQKIRAYCQVYQNEIELVGIYKDVASGKSLAHRPELKNVLQMLETGEAQGIIVAKLDRLTRSVRDMGSLLEGYFQNGKCSLLCVSEKIDTSTPSGRFMLNILTSIAEWERETIVDRTKAALAVKKSKGEKTGGYVPFGTDCHDGKLVPNADEQRILHKISQLKLQGFSYQDIADELNAQGITTKLGHQWNRIRVFKIHKANLQVA